MACEVVKLDEVNLAISPKENAHFFYQADQILNKPPYLRAFNCIDASTSGKYLMVSFGPEVMELEDTHRGINFNQEYTDSQCKIKNTPFKNESNFEDRLNDFKAKWNFIKSCVEVWVEDEGIQPLQMPPKQVGCELTKLSTHKVIFNGGFCYFKPNFGSSFLVQLRIKKECQNLSGLETFNIKKFDFNSAINFYLAGDASGNSTNLKALSNTKVRMTVNPEEKILNSSDDFGILYPTFPTEWKIPDINPGKIDITQVYQDRIKIDHSFLVQNVCQRKCIGQFCQGPCDYAQPVIAEISLTEKGENGKKDQFLTSWFEGGIANSGFEGFIQGIGFDFSSELLKEGKTYEITASFSDPKFDFEYFKKRVLNKLNTIDQHLGRITRSNIPNVQEIPSIQISRELPTFNTIPNITFDRKLDTVDQAIGILRNYMNFRIWPPYYSGACGTENCSPIVSSVMSITTTIKLGPLDEESKRYNFQILDQRRTSKILPNVIYDVNQQPYIECNQMDLR